MPFMISTGGYGLVWDNPSKTTVDLGFNNRNVWSSDVGDRVSYFVIAGDSSDEIYNGYRRVTGVAHLLPKAAYGYIQSKAIYPTQEHIVDIAKGYRERKLPLDVLVVDFLNMTRQGELDLDPKRWPDPAARVRAQREHRGAPSGKTSRRGSGHRGRPPSCRYLSRYDARLPEPARFFLKSLRSGNDKHR